MEYYDSDSDALTPIRRHKFETAMGKQMKKRIDNKRLEILAQKYPLI